MKWLRHIIPRRLRLAWQLDVWPWNVPWEKMVLESLKPLTKRDVQERVDDESLHANAVSLL